MKRYIIISYDGSSLDPSEVMAIASQLNTVKPDVTDVHADKMDATAVITIINYYFKAKNASELSVLE